MTLYGAIDLHSNNGVLSVIDEHDHVVFERRLPNDLELIRKRPATSPTQRSRSVLSLSR
jgi:hypothetical protein